jgi:apolipoprotein N-acyltransferase
MKTKQIRWIFLLMGFVLVALTHERFGLGFLIWVAPVPFLLYLRQNSGIRPRVLLAAVFVAAWSIACAKILTRPIPPYMALLYGLPLGLIQLAGYLIWDRLKNYSLSTFAFPAAMAVAEWLQYTFTPMGSWGAAAYTQLDNLPLLQFASLFGLPGISFVIYLVPSFIEKCISDGCLSRAGKPSLTVKRSLREGIIVSGILLSVLTLGAFRLTLAEGKGRQTVVAAAVGTDSAITGLPLPDRKRIEAVKKGLFGRTRRAADGGAKLVVWTEAAICILPEDEQEWKVELSRLSNELNIYLVAAYVVPVSTNPFLYENKYILFDSDGVPRQTYLKHRPVPGEPAVKSTDPLEALDSVFGRLSGAICYDYDFPDISREHGRLKSDIVAVPSSDWRGIDPIHTEMVKLRAIEGGHSVLRSTRWGLSAGIDSYGRIRGRLSDFDSGDKILLVNLPVGGIVTLYSIIGDSFIAVCVLILVFILVRGLIKKSI